MPTISVPRDSFCRLLNEGAPKGGKTYNSTHEIDELCFDYGLELDEDTSVHKHPSDPAPKEPFELKIEVPANRYDLLCMEGLVRALRIYLDLEQPPAYQTVKFDESTCLTARVAKDVARIRPYFAAAVLRNVKFTPESYASFIDLQDKLHQNLARKRTLVAIGTHDLDTMAPGEVSYEALPPKQIRFAPLNKTTEMNAEEMMEFYQTNDKHIARYLPIIRDSPVYPIIYDSKRTVLSMPPIINGDHTKITLGTRNIFFDLTATDQTKLAICCNILVTMFGQYSAQPFMVEPVRIIYEADGRTDISPSLAPIPFRAHASYLNSCTALSLSTFEICRLLRKMGHAASASSADSDVIDVLVPPSRPDILHECDLVEELAIAYGFNKLEKTFPSTNTVAKPLAINKLTDTVRQECAASAFIEALPLILCSHDENFAWLNRKDDGTTAVKLANPKTLEYQVVRTSLLPGLLKTIRENQSRAKPIRIFEVSDVSLKDPSAERRARNERRVAAVHCDRTGSFEAVHGLLDRLMLVLGVKWAKPSGGKDVEGPAYYLEKHDDPTFLPGRGARIMFRPRPAKPSTSVPAEASDTAAVSQTASSIPLVDAVPSSPPAQPATTTSALDTLKSSLASVLPGTTKEGGDVAIGTLGILHPSVLGKFEIPFPISAVEFSLEGL